MGNGKQGPTAAKPTDAFKDIEKLEKDLWEAADNLRANSKLTSSDYFMPVLGVIFLRHAANRFEAAHRQIEADQASGKMPRRKVLPADYIARRSLFLPQKAQFDWIMDQASVGGVSLSTLVTDAMTAIETDFEPLLGVLPKDYGIFEPKVLEDLMRLFNSERIKQASGDVFGRIYEYFLAKFSIQKAHDNGEFFTPSSIVQTIVNVIEPDHGTVFDPACGSGGMFVQSSHFIEHEGGDTAQKVVFYGQEKNPDTIRIAKMNLAVHGLEGKIADAITYYQDEHTLYGKCDFVMANPPFNVDLVDAKRIEGDPRLPFGLPGVSSTLIEIVISEAQNEVRDFQKWGFDIIPHRVTMKTGFQTPDGKRVSVEEAFKNPAHPFRIAIVCAMWLTGFDVECLATLYIDKPMKAHNLMQAIARANRVYPGKDCGVIVDYNGMLKSLRKALSQYAVGDGEENGPGGEIVGPIEELLAALIEAIEATENHLLTLGFDPNRLIGASGFTRIQALRDAVDAVYTSDETKRRYEIMAREVFSRFKALLMEPSALKFAERHDNIETIYKKLQDKRDTADVTELLKELHRIVNEAIRAAGQGDDLADGLTIDLSQIDFEKLRDEFATKVSRKNAVVQDVREVVEAKLAEMLRRNPLRMDYYRKYQEIIADYNREKDRVTVEATFAELVALAASLDAEQKRAAKEGLNDDELALFDLLFKDKIAGTERERLKQASRGLLSSLEELLRPIEDWTQKASTQAEVKVLILNDLYRSLPRPPYTDEEIEAASSEIYNFVWQKSASHTATWA